MRRLLVLVLLLTVVAGFNAFADTNPTKLTLWTFQPLHLDFYNAAVKVWNAQNPGKAIDLDGQAFPYADMHNKLLVAVQSGVGRRISPTSRSPSSPTSSRETSGWCR